MTKAISILRLIGNLANKGNYDYTEEQKRQIINTLNAEVKDINLKFSSRSGNGVRQEFKFKNND